MRYILLLCAVALCAPVCGAVPATAAGPKTAIERCAVGNREAMPANSAQLCDAPTRRLLLVQDTRPGSATGTPPPPDKETEALAAEIEKRWPDAERIYRELLAD